MDGELVARSDTSRATRDIPAVEDESALPKDWGELGVSDSKVPDEGADRNARRREGPAEIPAADRLASGSEQKDSRPRGHGEPKPAPL